MKCFHNRKFSNFRNFFAQVNFQNFNYLFAQILENSSLFLLHKVKSVIHYNKHIMFSFILSFSFLAIFQIIQSIKFGF